MTNRIRILFLSANPWTTSRILVDEEAREIFEKLQEGPDRDKFELHRHAAIRPTDLQRLLMMHEPHIVHFSGHGSKKQKIIFGGKPGRGKQVDRDGLVQVFALYQNHVRLVVLNACFTRTQARSLSEVIDYSVGAGQGIGDKEGVAFAGAFYRALGFGKSVKAAFESAKAELALTKMPRTKGLDLFVRNGVNEDDSFPKAARDVCDTVDVGSRVIDLFTNSSSADDILQREGAFLREERTEIAGSNKFETPTSPSSKQIYEEERRSCEQALVSPMRTKTRAPAQSLLRLRDKLSRSALTNLRKVKRAKRANSIPIEDEIEPRSPRSHSRAYVVLTIRVCQVAMSEPSNLPKPQASRTRASLRTMGLTGGNAPKQAGLIDGPKQKDRSGSLKSEQKQGSRREFV
jgi:hypothetical protein